MPIVAALLAVVVMTLTASVSLAANPTFGTPSVNFTPVASVPGGGWRAKVLLPADLMSPVAERAVSLKTISVNADRNGASFNNRCSRRGNEADLGP